MKLKNGLLIRRIMFIVISAVFLILSGPGCDSDTATPEGDGQVLKDISAVEVAVKDFGLPDGPAPDSCTPQAPDCTNLCGPVADPCTGLYHFCGSCAAGLACNLETHKCVTPLITCTNLKAQCGSIKNSCGKRIFCGYCKAGKECDADTNTCVACSGVTCQDLGYECGNAWLGCGPSSTKTACGTCPSGKKCNPNYGTCESACTPLAAKAICAAAKVSSGVECGKISNNCGGIADCGTCPKGTLCGVRGVANRCDKPEVPDECKAHNRKCGKLKSVCGGAMLDCGTCPAGEVCNTNGICGPPCQPKTCPVDYAGKCGTGLDDGCKGKLTCKCAPNMACSTTTPGTAGACIKPKVCTDYKAAGKAGDPCSNGPSPTFPKGNGSNLTCICAPGNMCVKNKKVVVGTASGSCCKNTAQCTGSVCSVTNTCTGDIVNCCTKTQYCDTTTNTCVNKKNCADYTNGLCKSPCSTSKIFPDGTGKFLTCNCSSGVCLGQAGFTPGSCCCNTNTCDGTSCTVTDSCTGATISCCTASECCDTTTNTCKAMTTCSAHTSGSCGSSCSTTAIFSDGCGGNIACGCASGGVCLGQAGTTPGKCCCNTNTCDGTSCTVTDSCTGATINCCTSSQFCDSTTSTCKNKKTCADHTDGKCSSPCSTSAIFADGAGGFLTCPCNSGGTCTGQSGTTPGSCCCNTNACNGTSCTVTNSCTGATISCCKSTEHCVGTQCVATTCAAPYKATGKIGDPCSTVKSSAFPLGNGTSLKCPCTSGGNLFNNKCLGSSSSKSGLCKCTPDACNGRVGIFNDGCGGQITCSG